MPEPIVLNQGEEDEIRIPTRNEVCHRCMGDGTHDAWEGGMTVDEMYEQGEDFIDDYRRGVYSVPCTECNCNRVVAVPDEHRAHPRAVGGLGALPARRRRRAVDDPGRAADDGVLLKDQLPNRTERTLVREPKPYDITVVGWVTVPAGLAPATKVIETKMTTPPLVEVAADARREDGDADGDTATYEVTLWGLLWGDTYAAREAAEAAAMRLKALAQADSVVWLYQPSKELEAF